MGAGDGLRGAYGVTAGQNEVPTRHHDQHQAAGGVNVLGGRAQAELLSGGRGVPAGMKAKFNCTRTTAILRTRMCAPRRSRA